MLSPYNEGLIQGRLSRTELAECPYRTDLVSAEREQWLAGFRSARTDALPIAVPPTHERPIGF